MMKKAAVLIVSIILLAAFVISGCAPAGQGKKLTVAIDATYPPFEQVNEKTGQVEGYSVDMMNAIAAKAGLDIEYVNISYAKLLEGVASCQYDIGCSSITITEERKKVMLFSDSVNSGGQIIVVRKDNTDVKGKDDLAGKVVAAQGATTSAAEAGKIPNVKLKTYTAMTDVFQALLNSECDAIVTDTDVSAYFVAKNPDKAKIVGPQLTNEVDGIAVCNKNEYLLPKINAALKELKNDGTLDKLRAKWLSLK
jgi:polar amino acid transport system substrate-binding protein